MGIPIKEAIAGFLSHNPIVLLFCVIGFGYLLGEIRFFGFRLGVAGVLFVGLALGALGPEVALPPMVSTFGLILFIYSIGVQFGPGFVNPFRRNTIGDSVFCVAILALGAIVSIGIAVWLDLSGSSVAGLFSGALTNAPALAGVQEVLRDQFSALPAEALRKVTDQPVIAFGVAYPFGVLGVMLSFQLYRMAFRIQSLPRAEGEPIEVRDFVIQNREVTNAPLSEVLNSAGARFIVSRIRRGEETFLATPESRLEVGDVVAVVGTAKTLELALLLLGEKSDIHIERDRTVLDFRRVFVSSEETVGKPIAQLNLQQRLSATITRLRRGDLDVVPTPETRLAYGDRIRVVTAPSQFAAVSRLFGDSIRGTAEINFASVGLGMALGVILGLIPFPMPGGDDASPRICGRAADCRIAAWETGAKWAAYMEHPDEC